MKAISKGQLFVLLAVGLALATEVALAGSDSANLGATRLAVASGPGDYTKEESGWEDISGAVTRITVPAEETGLIVARFTAASRCDQGRPRTLCEIQILANGVPMSPSPIWFDMDDGANFTEAHATQVVGGPFGPGTYVLSVQFRTSRPTFFALFDFVLTAELWRVT